MAAVARSAFNTFTWAQLGLVAVGMTTLAFAPPAEGPIALIALDGGDASRLAAPAIAHGALLLGRGPRLNILMVRGRRNALTGEMLSRGVILLAAPTSWCGPRGSAR